MRMCALDHIHTLIRIHAIARKQTQVRTETHVLMNVRLHACAPSPPAEAARPEMPSPCLERPVYQALCHGAPQARVKDSFHRCVFPRTHGCVRVCVLS